ncbi:cytochrome c biogenesis protein CcsA, partial [bacterium]|nr:cytochrome c biogenesis protein CcsA [bacterium]
RMVFWKEQLGKQFRKILTVSVMAIIFIALMLPESLKTPKPLMPALNSIWMYIHVPSYFLGYMAMLVAVVYAVLLLVQKENNGSVDAIIKRMDNEVKIAFFFLTIGMVTGGIWAYVSWGNYWAWDPKETWALINIIVLSFYFHLNTTTKQKKAVIVLFTFLTIAFTYWGVSFILSGLHSYT